MKMLAGPLRLVKNDGLPGTHFFLPQRGVSVQVSRVSVGIATIPVASPNLDLSFRNTWPNHGLGTSRISPNNSKISPNFQHNPHLYSPYVCALSRSPKNRSNQSPSTPKAAALTPKTRLRDSLKTVVRRAAHGDAVPGGRPAAAGLRRRGADGAASGDGSDRGGQGEDRREGQ